MRDQVITFLKGFERAYHHKNISDIDIFMYMHFSSKEAHVLGTSTQEVYLSFDEIKACIKNDWLYWGNLSLNYDQIKTSKIGDFIVINVFGKVSYAFEDNLETDQRFVELIKALNQEADHDDLNHLVFQQNDMSYILDHFLHRRRDKKRINDIPLSLTFFVKKEDEHLKILQLSYDVATYDQFPDVMIHPYSPYEQQVEADLEKLKAFGQKLEVNPFDMELSDQFYVIDVDHKIYHDPKNLRKIINRYDHLNIDFDHCLIQKTDQTLSFMTMGTVKLYANQVDLRASLKEEINHIIDSDLKDIDKLYKIRRKISLLNKMSALDAPLICPMKCVGYMTIDHGSYQLEMIKFSYPMDLILEDKYM